MLLNTVCDLIKLSSVRILAVVERLYAAHILCGARRDLALESGSMHNNIMKPFLVHDGRFSPPARPTRFFDVSDADQRQRTSQHPG